MKAKKESINNLMNSHIKRKATINKLCDYEYLTVLTVAVAFSSS